MLTTRTQYSTTLPADTRPSPHAPIADERGLTLLTEAELASVAAAGSNGAHRSEPEYDQPLISIASRQRAASRAGAGDGSAPPSPDVPLHRAT